MAVPIKTAETKQGGSVFDYVSVAIIIAGIALFYILHINIWLKWGIVLLSVVAAITTFFWVSPTGLQLHGYVRDSWRELGKVVWPSRKEAVQFTWIVFILVLILGLFLWLIDTSLSWLFYGVILGRSS